MGWFTDFWSKMVFNPDFYRNVNSAIDQYGFNGALNKGYQDYQSQKSQPNGLHSIWDDITGRTNTDVANSATAALQEDAQQFNAEEAEKQRQYESAEAEKARQWQEEMSNTAVQRQANDLKTAGFNPWLAASGSGASTGSVGIAGGDSASSSAGQGINATKSGSEVIQTVANAAISAAMIMKVFKMLK